MTTRTALGACASFLCARPFFGILREMATYRFFPIDPEGHIVAPSIDVDCASDLAAMELAPALMGGRTGLDVWIGARRVTTRMRDALATV